MAKIKIRFTGMCAFVPSKKTVPQRNDNEVHVLLCGGTGHAHGMGAAFDDIHVPVLVVPSGRVASGGILRQKDATFFEFDPETARVEARELFLLADQHIEINGAAPNSLTVIDGAVSGDCPISGSGGNSNFFSWVARIPSINSTWGKVNPDCIDANSAIVPSAVGARWKLSQGELSVRSIFPEAGIPIVSNFRRPGSTTAGPHSQALAEEVEYSFDSTSVVLAATGLRGTSAKGNIQLTASSDLTIWVKSMPIIDVLSVRGEKLVIGTHRRGDFHFDHFYRFSESGPQVGAGHIPLSVSLCSGGPAVGNPKCPPAQLSI